MLFALAGAAIGAGLSYLSAQEQQGNVDKQKSALANSKISPAERERMLRDLDKGFNANIATQSNSAALAYRGTDASLAKAAMLGTSEGARISAKGDMFSKITTINKSIQAQIASISDVNVADSVASGAIQGGIAGAQIGELSDFESFDPASTDIAGDEGLSEMMKFDEEALSLNDGTIASNLPIDTMNRPNATIVKPQATKTRISPTVDKTIVKPKADLPDMISPHRYNKSKTTNLVPDLSVNSSSTIKDRGPSFYGQPSFGGASVIGNMDSINIPRPYSLGEMAEGVGKAIDYGAQGLDWLGSNIWSILSKEKR